MAAAPEDHDRSRHGRQPESLVHAIRHSERLIGLSLGGVTAVLLGLLLVNSLVFRPRLDEALQSAEVLRQRHEAMLDQQTGLRGYVLSGDERYLEAYERGVELLGGEDADVFAVTSRDRRATELYLDMRLAQQAWVDGLATRAVDSVQAGSGAPPQELLEQDKVLFDAYREKYERTIAELVRVREAALVAHRSALFVAVGLALLVMLGAGAVGFRRTRVLRQAVGEPLSALLSRLEGIGSGDLAPMDIVSGPAEFEALARGLEEAAATLAAAGTDAERRAAELKARSERQREVLRFAREVAGSLSMRYVMRGVCHHAAAVADGSRVVVWLLADDGASLHPFADSHGPDLQPSGLEPRTAGDDAVGWAGSSGRRRGLDDDRDEGELELTMVVGARVVGVLELTGPQAPQLSTDALQVLETLAVHAATAIEAARLHELTVEMAVTDQLTGLPNRRRLDKDLELECAASTRDATPLALLILDVDDFKAYNDTFGHEAGDRILQRLSPILVRNLRHTDDAYRYGGEEFAIILRGTTPEAAQRLAERLRKDIERDFIAPDEPRQVTVSIGVAGLPKHDPTPRALIVAADAALYDAKNAGRNRVRVAGAAGQPEDPSRH